MKSMKNKLIVMIFLFFIIQAAGYAQPPDVVIEGIGSRVVEPSFRIAESPEIIDSVKPSQVPSYPLLVYQFPTQIGFSNIKAAEIETTDKLKQIYPFYAKIGMGSGIMPLGQLVFNSTRSKGYQYGATINHLSYFGSIENRDGIVFAPSNYDRTSSSLYGKIIDNHYRLSGQIDYNNYGFNYYGVPSDTISKSSISQRIQSIGGAFNYTTDFGNKEVLNYKVDLAYRYLFTKPPSADSLSEWRTQEHNIQFKTKGWYNYKSETFYGIVGTRFNNYSFGLEDSVLNVMNTGRLNNNTIIDLNPGVLTHLMDNKFKLDLGFSLALDIASESRLYIYPQAEIKYSLFNDIFIPFAGIGGGLTQNTFSKLAGENEYINASLPLENENNPYDIYGGIKGTLSKKMGFNVNASFKKITNKAFFITDTNAVYNNTFDVLYDSLIHTRIEASIYYQMDEKLKIDGLARFNSYEMMHHAFAWNLPVLEFQLRGSYNLYDKFLLNIDGRIETGRKALVYEAGEGVLEENDQLYVNLGSIVDFNLGVEYRYNKRITAFFQLNNIISQRYNSWYNYPVQPIQVMGGVSFRF